MTRPPAARPAQPAAAAPAELAVSTAASRAVLTAHLFPAGVPNLWCPPLTHYDDSGAIDRERMAAHLAFLTGWSKGLLVPGSTGDGWELTREEAAAVIEVALAQAERLGVHILLGALQPDAGEAARSISHLAPQLREMSAACGCAVCPPRGAGLSQEDMEEALAGLLQLGPPLALYQLPQVTENEMSPELVQRLAGRHSNFVLFKDTSGNDRVATAGLDLGGLFLVRGAEGGYAEHLKANGGCYDGLLLSSANYLGSALQEITELSLAGRRTEAVALSARLAALVEGAFAAVAGVPDGNVFTNSAKALDHFFAHGPRALAAPPPRLHAGSSLPQDVLRAAGEMLLHYEFMPRRGYLE